jgi:hypothetical protein
LVECVYFYFFNALLHDRHDNRLLPDCNYALKVANAGEISFLDPILSRIPAVDDCPDSGDPETGNVNAVAAYHANLSHIPADRPTGPVGPLDNPVHAHLCGKSS